jgi:hypothetical protein
MTVMAHRESLWRPIVAPAIWALHFTVCYIWITLACGRFGAAGGFDRARTGIGVLTAAAIAIMAWCFIDGFHRHGRRLPDRSNDDGTPEDRSRFMAFTTMLLAALSIVATVLVGYAVIAMGRCS